MESSSAVDSSRFEVKLSFFLCSRLEKFEPSLRRSAARILARKTLWVSETFPFSVSPLKVASESEVVDHMLLFFLIPSSKELTLVVSVPLGYAKLQGGSRDPLVVSLVDELNLRGLTL